MDLPLEIERVDILIDPLLFERCALRIPVLAGGLEERAIRRWLSELRPTLG